MSEHTTPTTHEAVADFVRRVENAVHDGHAAPPALPEVLALPLAERYRLLERGELSPDDVREAAADWAPRADSRYRACAQLREPGPGSDLRLGVKDTIDVLGFPTGLGLRHHRHHPRESADVLRPLTGATVNAKVVTTELNIGVGSGCVNPYFPHIDPAGSSTGSGVAVAANICDVSLGTDVLGSVRWPAGRCGVVGLRTTHDPRRLAGIFPLSPAMDAAGWVARTADDLAFARHLMGLGEPASAGLSLRVGLPRELRREGVLDPEVADALTRTADLLRQGGHPVTDADLGELWDCRGDGWALCARDAWDGHLRWSPHIRDELMPSTVAALETGAKIGDDEYARIRARMDRIRSGIRHCFTDRSVDVWLLPLDPAVPRPRGAAPVADSTIPDPDDPSYEREIGFTPVASFAGLPAITFPASLSAATGAPVAMQLVGMPGAEASLVRAAQDIAAEADPLDLGPRGL
jgi:Asp-tRNA(Asn)/Glu-tRNA(Gln) amidotransferase A subunit family amidase